MSALERRNEGCREWFNHAVAEMLEQPAYSEETRNKLEHVSQNKFRKYVWDSRCYQWWAGNALIAINQSRDNLHNIARQFRHVNADIANIPLIENPQVYPWAGGKGHSFTTLTYTPSQREIDGNGNYDCVFGTDTRFREVIYAQMNLLLAEAEQDNRTKMDHYSNFLNLRRTIFSNEADTQAYRDERDIVGGIVTHLKTIVAEELMGPNPIYFDSQF